MLDMRNQGNDMQEFVDRKEELNELKKYMEKVLNSRGRIVLLKGEVGIGKTVLADKFANICIKEGFKVLMGRCLYFESIDPYMPFLDALKEYISTGKHEDEVNKTDPMYSKDYTQSGGVAMSFLGLPAEEDSVNISLSDRREMMFDKITNAITDLAEKKPVLLFIDDLQWIDDASAKLLHHLTRHIRDCRVFILGAYRPEELTDVEEVPMELVLERMREEKLVEEIGIGRFPLKKSSKIIKKILGTEHLPNTFLQMIHRETEGNPYYIKEIINSMVDEGIIDPYSYVWDPEEELTDIIIPSSIKDITTRRIERLDKDEKKVLMYASVIGPEFDFKILEKAINIPVYGLLDIVENLESRGIINEMTESEKEMFRFNHIQTRLIIYSNLGKSRRRVLHRLVGNAIEEVYENNLEEYVFALSRHFYQGRKYDKVYDYSLKAGEKSLSRYAIENAIDYFQKARESLQNIHVESSDEKDIALLRRIGSLAYDLSDWDTAQDTFREVLKIAKKRKYRKLEAKSLWYMGSVSKEIQKFSEGKKYYNRALKISEKIQDMEGIAESHQGLGHIHWREGEFEEAIEHFKTAVDMSKKADAKSILALTYVDMGNTYAHMGEIGTAIEHYLKAIPTLKENKSWVELARAHNNLGDQHMKKGEWDKAIENFDKTVEYGKKVGNKKHISWGYHNKAESLANKGDTKKASIYVKRSESILEKLNDLVGLSMVYRVRGIINRVDQNYDKALEFMRDALDVIADVDVPFVKAEIKYNIALTYLDKGDKEKAKIYFEDA
ncbi:MAG: tetratricopeptide repeat protein, partial [Thermoplasmata archaeon]